MCSVEPRPVLKLVTSISIICWFLFLHFVPVGVDNIMSLIVDIYQSRKSLARLQQVVTQLKQDVMQQMDVPADQTEQTRNKLRDTVKQTVIQKVNGENICNTPFRLTNIGGVTCDGLASRPGGIEILLAASCYRNRDKLRQL